MSRFEKFFDAGICAFYSGRLVVKKLAERRYIIVDLRSKTTMPHLGPYNMLLRFQRNEHGEIPVEDKIMAEQLIIRDEDKNIKRFAELVKLHEN